MNKFKITNICFFGCLLFCVFCGAFNYSVTAHAYSDANLLSHMTEAECVEFIQENNVEIPNYFESLSSLGNFVKDTIVTIENDQDYNFAYSYDETQAFANDIKQLVNAYYAGDQDLQ